MTAAPALRAIFLAAGFATRLYPLTRDRPKALLEVGGEPLLTRLLRQVAATGAVGDAVVVTNDRFHAQFRRWQAELQGRIPVTLVNDGVAREPDKRGAIVDLEIALGAQPEPLPRAGYLVAAADNLCDFDLAPVVRRFLASGRPQLLLRDLPAPIPPRRYNEVTVDGSGRVTSFREKPADPASPLASIAVYLLPPELPALVAEYLRSGGPQDAPGHLLAWLVDRIAVEGSPIRGRWFDIGDAADLERAQRAFGSA